MKTKRAILVTVILFALASCKEEASSSQSIANREDPAISAALNDPIMSDPDLTEQNLGMVGVITPESDVQGVPVLPLDR